MESAGLWWTPVNPRVQWTWLVEKSGPNLGSPLEYGVFRWTTQDWTCQFGLCDTEKVWVTSLVDSSRLRWNPTESGRSCGAVYSLRLLSIIKLMSVNTKEGWMCTPQTVYRDANDVSVMLAKYTIESWASILVLLKIHQRKGGHMPSLTLLQWFQILMRVSINCERLMKNMNNRNETVDMTNLRLKIK